MKKDILTIAVLTGLTILSGTMLARIPNGAYAEVIDEVSVLVEPSCTLDSTLEGEHIATLDPGATVENLGKTKLDVTCNDMNGWALYAIGYGGDTEGNTNLSMTSGGTTYTIPTGTSDTSSYWAMKLFANNSTPTDTIVSGYRDYHAVPSDYDKVASSDVGTSLSAGSSLSTTYKAYADQGQAAGVYNGKVRYLLVHPSSAKVCGDGYVDRNGVCTPSFKSITTAQNMTAEVCATAAVGSSKELTDARDGKQYLVVKLADGNCWMMDNLRYDGKDASGNIIVADSSNTDLPAGVTFNLIGKTPSGSSSYPHTAGTEYDTSTRWAGSYTNAEYYPDNVNGYYYNWYAAVAGTVSGTSSATATGSICPKGWTLPIKSTAAGADSYENLLYAQNVIASVNENNNYVSGGFSKMISLPLNFTRTGSYDISSHTLDDRNTKGYYWTATSNSTTTAYNLGFTETTVNPSDFSGKMGGLSVRCVAR